MSPSGHSLMQPQPVTSPDNAESREDIKMAIITFTSDDLRKLADKMDDREKYDNMCGRVILTVGEYPNGRKYAQFEQPCQYAECFSTFYTFDEH